LTKKKMEGTLPRSNDFRADPDLPPGERAELQDYRGSGYDRGHMAPAASMKWDARAMSESFLLSNMAPQVGPGFNRGIWATLEDKVRQWTQERGELYVVAGPIILPNKKLRSDSLPTFIVSVDEVEAKTALSFLSAIDDEVENLIERRVEPMW
jgi:endonuclease G